MPPKEDEKEKVPMLKGPAAEKAVKDYVTSCNRPYGAADIAANMKTVSKPTAQKILVALAEKGEITQKTAGKQTYFVANQTDTQDLPPEKIAELEATLRERTERIKVLTASNKALAAELTSIRQTPTLASLPTLITELEVKHAHLEAELAPHRERARAAASAGEGGEGPPSEEEARAVDVSWEKWRGEWKKRKGLFRGLWQQVTDHLTPDAIEALIDELGIELDSAEHEQLERSALCQPARGKVRARTGTVKPAGVMKR